MLLAHRLIGNVPKGSTLAQGLFGPVAAERVRLTKAAVRRSVALRDCADINTPEDLDAIRGLSPDLILTVGWASKFSPELLDIPTRACVNIHPSLLPRYRGRYPISAAIYNSVRESGITYHLMNEEYDQGAILLKQSVWLHDRETSLSLLGKSGRAIVDSLDSFLDAFDADELEPEPQEHRAASYAPRFTADDAWIDWRTPTDRIDRKIRAYYPWHPCYAFHQNQRIEFSECAIDAENPESFPGEVLAVRGKSAVQVATSDATLWLRTVPGTGLFRNGSSRSDAGRVKVGDVLTSHPLSLQPSP